jgi:hypothetical protein
LISILWTSTERTQEAVKHLGTRPHDGDWKKWIALLLLFPLAVLASACEAWTIQKGLKEVGHEVQAAEGLGMEEAALYHLNVARSLLEAAEQQYEEADFHATAEFLDQSRGHLRRARDLHSLSESAPPPVVGGMP